MYKKKNVFHMTLSELGEWRSSISGLSLESLSSTDLEALETLVSGNEVLAISSSLCGGHSC